MTALTKVENTAAVVISEYGDTIIEKFLASRVISANSIRTYRNALRRLFKFFAANSISVPTEEAITAFVNSLKAEKKSDSTQKLYLTVAKSFFAWTGRKEIFPNVAADVKARIKKTTTHKREALTTKQAKALLTAIKGNDVISLRNRAIIALCLQCGLRTIEIERADVGDLHESNGYFILDVQGKGCDEKNQSVKVSRHVAEMIYTYLEARGTVADSEPLFASTSRNNSKYGARLSAQSVGKMIKATLKKIGVNDKRHSAHSTRHFAATCAIKAGVDLREVSSMLRHSNIQTTLTYLHDIDIENRRAELTVADTLFGGMAC